MRFFPRSQLHIIQSELFFDDPQAELDKLVLFLGLDGFEFSKLQPLGEGNYTPLDADVRIWLAQQYRESNPDLEVLLGRHFNWS